MGWYTEILCTVVHWQQDNESHCEILFDSDRNQSPHTAGAINCFASISDLPPCQLHHQDLEKSKSECTLCVFSVKTTTQVLIIPFNSTMTIPRLVNHPRLQASWQLPFIEIPTKSSEIYIYSVMVMISLGFIFYFQMFQAASISKPTIWVGFAGFTNHQTSLKKYIRTPYVCVSW